MDIIINIIYGAYPDNFNRNDYYFNDFEIMINT